MEKKQPVEISGKTRMIRRRLKAARKALGLTQQQVAERMVADPQWGGATLGATAISNWELLERNPEVDAMAAWARAVGRRLVVELDDQAAGDRVAVLLPPEVVECAKAITALEQEDLNVVEDLVALLVGDHGQPPPNLIPILRALVHVPDGDLHHVLAVVSAMASRERQS